MFTLYSVTLEYVVDELIHATCIINDELDDSTTANMSVAIQATIVVVNNYSASDNIKVDR